MIVLGDLDDKLYYNDVINDDCQLFFYSIEQLKKINKDGWYSYILCNLLSLTKDVTNINIFVDNSEYFQGLVGCLKHYQINTDCCIFRDEINLLINEIKKKQICPLNIVQLEKIIKKLKITDNCEEIIDELFDIGFCFYNNKNEIVYLREFI